MTPTTDTHAVEPWRRALLPPDASMRDVIRNLDETGLQIAIVVSPEGTLVGTVTDGDIRRGLLRGLDLNAAIDTLIQREPLVVPPAMGEDPALQLMRANKVHQLPIVDEQRRVVGLHVWRELVVPTERPNVIVLMAGGMGTRLRPHTESCPKPLLPVAGKPLLEHIIERVRAEGFRRLIVSVHHLGHLIEEHLGDGARWQVQITYLREQTPLGTAGALGLLNPRPELPFVVCNADLLTDVRYAELLGFHSRHGAVATMAVRLHEWQHPFGVVRTKGVDITGFEEKPVSRTHINAGIYVLEPAALDQLCPAERCDMPQLFIRLKETGGRTIVYPIHEPWLDVGRRDDLDRANTEAQ